MIRKLFPQMLVSQIISAMTVMLCMLVDSIMIGRFLGVPAMTAYGLATPVLLVFAAFGSMLSAGIQVYCGKAMGAGDSEGTKACYSTSLFLAAVIALTGLVLVFVFAGPLSTLLGAGNPGPGNEIHTLTKDYLRGFIVGAPAFLFAQIMVPYLQIAGKRSLLVAAVAAMTVGDVALDLLNVFVFKGGTLGMGLASSASYYIAFVIGITYFLGKKCMFRFQKSAVSLKAGRALAAYGVPTVINQISLVLLVFVLNKILINTGGETAVASYSVISTVGNLCYAFSSGVAAVALTLSAIFYSDEDRQALLDLMRLMTFYALALCGAVTVLVLIFAGPLTGMFLSGSPAANALAAKGLRLFVLSLICCALNTALKNYYQGVNRTGFTEQISVMQNFAFPAIFAFILSRFWGTTGVWLAYLFGESLTLMVICAVAWKKNRRVAVSVEVFSLLEDDFGAAQNECLEREIRSIDDSVLASREAADFCKAHGESAKNCMLISLCIEEMANNIVAHGFTKDSHKHQIELRLTFKDGKRVLRLRDNCVDFDPVDYMKLHQSDDPMAHIGIRMVMKMVKDANYINSLGLNNLTLVL